MPCRESLRALLHIRRVFIVVDVVSECENCDCHIRLKPSSHASLSLPSSIHIQYSEPRCTRSGTRFSPWDTFTAWDPAKLTALGFTVHQTAVSLEELIENAERDRSDGREEDSGESDDEWHREEGEPDISLPKFSSSSPAAGPSRLPLPPLIPPQPSHSSSPPASGQLSRAQERKIEYQKTRRRKQRQRNTANPFNRVTSSAPTHLVMSAQQLPLDFDASDIRTTKGGHWLGVRDQNPPKLKNQKESARWANHRLPQVGELVNDLKRVYVSWDARRPLLILDCHGRIIVVFVGGPDDPEWPSVAAEAGEALKRAREEGIRTNAFAEDAGLHRRGRFYTLKSGVSHGGGQPCPRNGTISDAKQPLVDSLLGNKSVRRICGFQSSAFRTWAPKLFKDYVTDLQDLFKHDPSLQLNFTNSIFPSVTFNLGPQSTAFEHLDDKNRALGWCAITSAGDFDPKKSAHLHLKELNTVVEFPPASTSFIPSAVIHHGNTPLAPHEIRYSITQYAAGGLFRYVQYKFRTAKKVLTEGGENLKRLFDGVPGERHAAGINLFSKPEELMADHMSCFGAKG
ncbi:hypothetical protein R3P38DRAFT_3317614 [Favolaschia claudopus]|uniref:Uncharacterized protein n=1 Tax=Favolaschia claudopus TaxID=2862362 RepID=A0AAW0B872_9AGAR